MSPGPLVQPLTARVSTSHNGRRGGTPIGAARPCGPGPRNPRPPVTRAPEGAAPRARLEAMRPPREARQWQPPTPSARRQAALRGRLATDRRRGAPGPPLPVWRSFSGARRTTGRRAALAGGAKIARRLADARMLERVACDRRSCAVAATRHLCRHRRYPAVAADGPVWRGRDRRG